MSVPELKVFVHGKSVAIGKTKFSIQFVIKHFPEEYDPEIEYTGRRTMTVDGKDVKVEISDVSGGDDSLCAKYITAAHGLIFMYSLDWPESLQALKTIYGEVTSLKKVLSSSSPTNVTSSPPNIKPYYKKGRIWPTASMFLTLKSLPKPVPTSRKASVRSFASSKPPSLTIVPSCSFVNELGYQPTFVNGIPTLESSSEFVICSHG